MTDSAENVAPLTPEQDAALDRLAESIAAHVKAPRDEPEPCLFHRALRVNPPDKP